MAVETLIICLVVGAVAGWLAAVIVTGGGFGLIGDIVIGIIGAFVGGYLLPGLGIFMSGGVIGAIINALIGAVILLVGARTVVYWPFRTSSFSVSSVREPPPKRTNPPETKSSTPPAPTAAPKVLSATPSSQAGARRLFISYRRSDSLDVTGRIYDRLTREFDAGTVFRDIDSVPLGIDFREHVGRVISDCEFCLVVIGPGWLSVPDGKGGRRIDDPRDHVRQEIEAALKRTIPVVPLLTGGASMPSVEELPASLQDLAFRNGVQIRPDPDFHRDMDRLLAGLAARR